MNTMISSPSSLQVAKIRQKMGYYVSKEYLFKEGKLCVP